MDFSDILFLSISLPFFFFLSLSRHKSNPFLLLVTGDRHFLSALLRAYITGPHFPIWLYFLTDIDKTLRITSSSSSSTTAAATEKKEVKEEEKYSHQSICK